MSLFVPLEIHSVQTQFLVDTGAVVTVLSSRIYQAMPEAGRPPLRQPTEPLKLEVANDELLEIDGVMDAKFDIDGQNFEHKIYVAPIAEEGLLGMDFLCANDYELGARYGLKLNGQQIYTEARDLAIHVARVTLPEDTIIPATTQVILPARVELRGQQFGSKYGLTESLPGRSIEGLLIGRALVDPTDHIVPVRVLNANNENVELNRGTVVALIHEVDDFVVTGEDESLPIRQLGVIQDPPSGSDDVDMSAWPDTLRELLARATNKLSADESSQLARLLSKHVGLFAKSPTDLGRTSIVQHVIDTGDAKPIKQAPRRPPRAFAGEEEKILQQQLDAGVIRESTSPWSSPLVYVRKRDGSTRPCVDYRKLNEVTRKDAYPLPRIDECLDSLANSRLFSTLDLQSGYWQVELKEEDRCKTSFVSRHGQYEYVVLPMGLCNAPATFERCMDLVLKGLRYSTLLVYLDDIIVMGSSFQEHLERLDEVFSRLGKTGLKLKGKKCELLQKEVPFLGHVVSAEGLKPDPARVAAIKEWGIPKIQTDVRSFLELCSYYRRFIPRFSTCAHPLNQLLEAGQPFRWTEDRQNALDDFKCALTSDNLVACPEDDGFFILDTDASNVGIGAVLSQIQWNAREHSKWWSVLCSMQAAPSTNHRDGTMLL